MYNTNYRGDKHRRHNWDMQSFGSLGMFPYHYVACMHGGVRWQVAFSSDELRAIFTLCSRHKSCLAQSYDAASVTAVSPKPQWLRAMTQVALRPCKATMTHRAYCRNLERCCAPFIKAWGLSKITCTNWIEQHRGKGKPPFCHSYTVLPRPAWPAGSCQNLPIFVLAVIVNRDRLS